jgi:hypothetical protein
MTAPSNGLQLSGEKYCTHAYFYSEDGGSKFFRNIDIHLLDYKESQPRIPQNKKAKTV